MILDRRDVFRLLSLAAGGATVGCGSRRFSKERRTELALRGPGIETFANTACTLCEGGCGVTVRLVDGQPVGIRGNPRHPINRGGLCPVGHAALDLLYSPQRLTRPLARDGRGGQAPVSWDDALARIAERLAATPGDRVALLSDEPGALFHDLLGRLAAALESPNLARATGEQALPVRLAQGLHTAPAVDLIGADVVASFGLDLFEDGTSPLYATSALVGARDGEDRARLIHIGSRLSPSAAKADRRVTVRPGSYAAFALGVAHVLLREERFDRAFVAEHCDGFEDWTDPSGAPRLGLRRLLQERYYPDRAAQLCGCRAADIFDTAHRLAAAARPLAVVGGEALATGNGLWATWAVDALNVLLGALGRRGGVVLPPPIPFTPLGEAAPAAGPSIFAPEAPALAADPVTALARRVLAGERQLDVLLVVEANPLLTSPAAALLRQALERIPLVVALTPFLDETAARATLALPTSLFLESWRDTTTPAGVPFSVLGIAHPVVEPAHEARHAGDVVLEIARRLGGASARALPWADYPTYLKHRLEGLVLSGQGSVVSGSFEEAWVRYLEERGWRFLEHGDVDAFWDDLSREGAWWNPVRSETDLSRLLPRRGRYSFFVAELEQWLVAQGGGDLAAGAARVGLHGSVDELCLPHYEPPLLDGEGELVLVPFRPTTGRGRLGAASPMVQEMFGYSSLSGWETWVELAPETAADLGVADGDRLELASAAGKVPATVVVSPGAAPGVAHVPLGLGDRHLGTTPEARTANPLEVATGAVEPLTGAPVTATRVSVRRLARRAHGGPPPSWMEEA